MGFFRIISASEVDIMCDSLTVDAQPKVAVYSEEEDLFCRILLSANGDQEENFEDEFEENGRRLFDNSLNYD